MHLHWRLMAVAALTGVARVAHADSLTPEDAAKHVGQEATVCGLVAGAKYAQQVRGGMTFIDFGKPYPNSVFTAMIFASDRAKFGTPEKTLQGKQVCVTGTIRLYQGKPEIILSEPKQLIEK